MSRRTITLLGWIVIPAGIILSCVLSLWLTDFLFSNTFTFWKSLGSPPTGVTTIVYADGLKVWVETNNGQLFKMNVGCYREDVCKKWIEVKDISEIDIDSFTSIKRGDNCEELDIEELPRNPNGIMTDCVLTIYPG